MDKIAVRFYVSALSDDHNSKFKYGSPSSAGGEGF